VTKAYTLFALAFMVLLSACAGDTPAKQGTGNKYTVSGETYKRVWRAANAAAGRHITVENSNEAAGTIRGHADGSEEIGVFIKRSRSKPDEVEVEVAGGKSKGLTISSAVYNSPKAKNWARLIFKELEYELETMDQMDALAAAPRPSSLRLEDMSPEMRRSSQKSIRAQIREEVRAEMRREMRRERQLQQTEDFQEQEEEEVEERAPPPRRRNAQPPKPRRVQRPDEDTPAASKYQGRRKYTDMPAPVRAPVSSTRSRASRSVAPEPEAAQEAEPAPARAVAPPRRRAPAVAAPLPKTTLTLRERLGELKKMYQEQLIGQAEYDAKKDALLDEL
jgi:hypothetical protein